MITSASHARLQSSKEKGNLFAKELYMNGDSVVFLNGGFVKWHEATVHIMSHSFGRGSAIFEVLGFQTTKKGRFIFRLDDHVNRLFETAKLLDMELPLSREAIFDAVIKTVQKNSLNEGFIKIIGFYPQISFETTYPQKMLDLAIFILNPDRDLADLNVSMNEGVSACLSKWTKLSPRMVPTEAKVAANYLNGIMAKNDAKDRGFDFAIMCDDEGHIAEGATESVFFIKDDTLFTPALGTILNSITRRSTLEVARVTGIKTVEDKLSRDIIYEADEIFLSGTSKKILPVKRMEDHVFEEIPGRITEKLSDLMNEIVSGEDDRFAKWLFPAG
jgi:branched-chain amino acid aminotransferase